MGESKEFLHASALALLVNWKFIFADPNHEGPIKDKFENVPVEADARILFRDNNVKVGERTARYEMWSWDGIHGESLMFFADDVLGLTDEDFKGMLTDGNLLKNPENFTVTRKTDFVFVNYNAEMN